MTQAQLGDALGLSAVHVNRVLQELELQKLISWKGSILTILSWKGLAEAAEFDASYPALKAIVRRH